MTNAKLPSIHTSTTIVDGEPHVVGYVNEEPIIALSYRLRGFDTYASWQIEESSALPVDIELAKIYIKCHQKAMDVVDVLMENDW